MENIEKFSDENIKKSLIERINEAFGDGHEIKLALFKPVSYYNDEYDKYQPLLILVDKNHEEVDHDIQLHDLCPDSNEQYNDGDFLPSLKDLTIKF